jgi:hypothetical protein
VVRISFFINDFFDLMRIGRILHNLIKAHSGLMSQLSLQPSFR